MSSFVDLTRPPYQVVPDDPGKASHNAAGINAAIADHSGKGAVLQLPAGEIYVDRGGGFWSIRVPPGAARVCLRGTGMFTTTLVQHGAGPLDAEWSLLVVDSCTDVQISDLGLRQGTIERPSGHDDHNSLLDVVALTQSCRNVILDQLSFGSCIGDALRVLGDAAGGCCENVRLTNFVMDTGGHSHGAGGLGLGSRSGISLRSGIRKLEIGHGFLRGARSCPLEIEPGGSGALEDLFLHHLVVDNSGGQSATAISLAGSLAAPIERMILNDVIVLDGNVSAALTRDATVSNLTIRPSRDARARGYAAPSATASGARRAAARRVESTRTAPSTRAPPRSWVGERDSEKTRAARVTAVTGSKVETMEAVVGPVWERPAKKRVMAPTVEMEAMARSQR